jgi:hypothetical protein
MVMLNATAILFAHVRAFLFSASWLVASFIWLLSRVPRSLPCTTTTSRGNQKPNHFYGSEKGSSSPIPKGLIKKYFLANLPQYKTFEFLKTSLSVGLGLVSIMKWIRFFDYSSQRTKKVKS